MLRRWADAPPPPRLLARARSVAMLSRMWDVLKLDAAEGGAPSQRPLSVGAPYVLALLGACSPAAATVAARLDSLLALLVGGGGGAGAPAGGAPAGGAPCPTLPGAAVAGLPEVPAHLRARLRARVQVLCRLRGETPTLDSAEALRRYLDEECDGLLTRLASEWWAVEDLAMGGADGAPRWVGRELRPEYAAKR